PYSDAIPTIPPSAIQAFLSSPLVIEQGELDRAGYVAVGQDSAIVLGKFSVFYGRGLPPEDSEFYRIFRPGKSFIDPHTNEFLGVEAQHIGDARMLQPGETARMEVVRSYQEVSPGDRMLPAPQEISLPYYAPRAPDQDVRGSILHVPDGVVEAGPYSVVVISLGARENMAPGHVLRILHQAGPERDPVTRKMFIPPESSSGLLIVFRTFEKVSYALVVQATRAVHIQDYVATP
ncbi:MAG: peptidoglycan-binding protein, partial [Gammaproteobacteria bacterium]|nr:peptidoglycan-binding protein [Gammaproteobacteria bacterium]